MTERFRTAKEVKYLTNQIQDKLEWLEEDYQERRKCLFDRKKEIEEQQIEDTK